MQLSYLRPQLLSRHAAILMVRAATAILLLAVSTLHAAEPTNASRQFAAVSQAIQSYFATLPGYQDGDLISQSHVAGALAYLERAGWKVTNGDKAIQRALPDDAFIVKCLSTPAGREFMRKISGEPGAYERLDRLSSISHGRELINDLLHRPGGDELITYLTTTNGGHNLGKLMAGTPHGVDLNKPTKRFYTASDLIAAIKPKKP